MYNKITELCFGACVDNFYNRNISDREVIYIFQIILETNKKNYHSQGSCVDNCVKKFSYVNQKLLGVYVDVQTDINTRRLAEVEAQAREVALQQEQKNQIENQNSMLSNIEGTSSVTTNPVIS